jgi:hypothetical protein
MSEKTLFRLASDPKKKYIVIHPTGGILYPGEEEQNKVEEIVIQAEQDLKKIFDRSDPALASGVKLGIAEIL